MNWQDDDNWEHWGLEFLFNCIGPSHDDIKVGQSYITEAKQGQQGMQTAKEICKLQGWTSI